MKLAKAFGYTFLTRELMLVLAFVNAVILARALGPSRYGAFALVVAMAGFLATFVSMGLPWSNRIIASRDIASSGRLLVVSSTFFLWYVPSALLLGWLVPEVMMVLSGPIRPALLVYVLVGAGVLSYYNNLQSILLGQERYRVHSLLTALPSLGPGLTNLALFLLGWLRLEVVVQVWLAWAVGTAFLSLVSVFQGARGDFRFDPGLLREAHSIGFRALVCAVFGYGTNRGNHAILNRFAGSASVGLFHVSMTIASVIGHAAGAVSVIVTNRASSERIQPADVMRLMRLQLIVGALGAAVIFATAPLLMVWLFGRAYSECDEVVRILLVGTFAYGLHGIAGSHISGKHGFPVVVVGLVGLMSILTVGLGLALVPSIGLEGAAWAYTIASVIASVLTVQVFFRDMGAEGGWRNLIPRKKDLQVLKNRLFGSDAGTTREGQGG